ncbi:MAG: holin [Ruminococcaceae bacterium]|nr:holin [Oscillospiraceae bacterium]
MSLLERLRSPVALGAIVALVGFITKEWLGWEIPGYDKFVELVMAALVAFGVVNNPTDRERF